MGHHRLPASPPAASSELCVVGQTDDDGTSIYFELAHLNIHDIVDTGLCRDLGGGSKLVLGDENSELGS